MPCSRWREQGKGSKGEREGLARYSAANMLLAWVQAKRGIAACWFLNEIDVSCVYRRRLTDNNKMASDPQQQQPIIARGPCQDPTIGLSERAALILEIAKKLEDLDLAGWTHPLLIFFRTYDGIEQFAVADDPIGATYKLLQQYANLQAPILLGKIADDICDFQILFYRAAWFNLGSLDPIQVWDPLVTSFREFRGLATSAAEWRLWKDQDPSQDLDQVKRNLLANYVKVNGFS